VIDRAELSYPPLGTLKSVDKDIWLVDGPLIRFGMPWPKMPFPTRMTLIRLNGNDLFVHSPIAMSPRLKSEVEAVGTVRWIIGPNRLHYSWIPDWRTTFPAAGVYLAPRIREQAEGRIDFASLALNTSHGYPWDAEIATLPVAGSFMTEVVFFHRASRTLVLTDLIENFERHRVSWLMRWLARLGGVLDPDGGMPLDMRFTFRERTGELRRAIETMIAWDPQRIILAHGRWYDRDAVEELRRAFRWLLKSYQRA